MSLKARPKPLANQPVVVDSLYFLWARDEREYDHPRLRLQLSLSLLFMLYMGIRQGEFVESNHYKGSNEGVLYRDLKIFFLYAKGGDRKYFGQVTLRNREGRRGQEDKAFVPLASLAITRAGTSLTTQTLSFTMNLKEERDSPARCPIRLILGLAIADGALEGVDCVEDLASLRPSTEVLSTKSLSAHQCKIRRCSEHLLL